MTILTTIFLTCLGLMLAGIVAVVVAGHVHIEYLYARAVSSVTAVVALIVLIAIITIGFYTGKIWEWV